MKETIICQIKEDRKKKINESEKRKKERIICQKTVKNGKMNWNKYKKEKKKEKESEKKNSERKINRNKRRR